MGINNRTDSSNWARIERQMLQLQGQHLTYPRLRQHVETLRKYLSHSRVAAVLPQIEEADRWFNQAPLDPSSDQLGEAHFAALQALKVLVNSTVEVQAGADFKAAVSQACAEIAVAECVSD